MSVRIKRIILTLPAILLLAGIVTSVLPNRQVLAAFTQITDRSLTLQDGATDGGSKAGGVVNHLFTFTIPQTATAIKSIKFQYCTTADIDIGGACTMPTGLVTTSATLGSPNGGFTSAVVTANGAPYVTSASGINANVLGGVTLSIQLATVTNQDGTNCGGSNNCTFFVRISTYGSTDTTGSILNAGTVAASTAEQIQLTGTMPESLIFCTGATVNVTCTTTTSGIINFNQLFSPTATAFATSQMSASTNGLSGYVITVSGPTMTSGANTVTPIGATPAISTPGTRQFGMNLAANTGVETGDPNITSSAYVTPAADGGDHMGSATANFDTGDPSITAGSQQSKFAFDDSALNIVAKSDNGANLNYVGNVPGPTNSQVFTASYIVNVSGNLPAGTYKTTLTYICTPTY